MSRFLLMIPLSFTLALATGAAAGESSAKAAPDFTLPATDGSQVTLSEHRGKVVVLEWFNPDCPFVVYAHGDGPLKEQPAAAMADGVVWLAINSGAPGKQGHGLDRNTRAREEYGMGYPVLLDEDGAVGKAYGARSTPEIVVIDPEGAIVYQGALDTAPLGKGAGKDGYVNYADAALAAQAAGQAVDPARTKSYGCSVKYGK